MKKWYIVLIISIMMHYYENKVTVITKNYWDHILVGKFLNDIIIMEFQFLWDMQVLERTSIWTHRFSNFLLKTSQTDYSS